MKQVITLVGLVMGRAFSHPVAGTPGDKGVPIPEDHDSEYQKDVTLTIKPTGPVKSGDIMVLCDELHEEDFLQGAEVDIYIGPKGFAKETMDKVTTQSTEIANLQAELSRLRVLVDQLQSGKVDPNAKAGLVPVPQPNAPTSGQLGGPAQQSGEAKTT